MPSGPLVALQIVEILGLGIEGWGLGLLLIQYLACLCFMAARLPLFVVIERSNLTAGLRSWHRKSKAA